MKQFLQQLLCLALALLLCCTWAGASAEECISVRYGSRDEKRVAITVDDCYDPEHIQEILDLCQEHDIRITFFVIGEALKAKDAELWQSVVDAGCELGNHTWGHDRLINLTKHKIKFQLLRAQQKVDELLGYHYPMQVMRPPLGKTNKKVRTTAGEVGYLAVVRWDVAETDPEDAFAQVENGSILLYHARQKDVDCLEKLIPALLEAGYECVTVSELLGFDAVVTSPEMYVYRKEDAE